MASEDEILKCGRSLPELVENDSKASLTLGAWALYPGTVPDGHQREHNVL